MKRFRVLVADPPWRFADALGRRGAAAHYPTLSIWQLCDFPLPPLGRNAVLFLWRVGAMQEEALQLCRAWGFEPKSEIVWEKTTTRGNPHFGLGRIVRWSHESCIIATRGRPKVRAKNVRSRFSAPVGRHSQKPETFFDLVERLYDGPYAELFARRRRPGWACYGNEV